MKKTRMTNQKIKILQHLKSVRTHPTAEMVYAAVKKDLPAISLATVYRNLHQLSREGKVLKLEINGEFRFDGDVCNHQHFVCTECGRIIDIFHEEISEYALKKVKTLKFHPSCVHIIYRGICDKCGKGNSGRKKIRKCSSVEKVQKKIGQKGKVRVKQEHT